MNRTTNFTQEIEDLKGRMLSDITNRVKKLGKALYFPSEDNKIGEYKCGYISLDSDGENVNINVILSSETTEMRLVESLFYNVESMNQIIHLLSWYGDEDEMAKDYIKAHAPNDVDANDSYEMLSKISLPDFVMQHKEMLYRTPDGEVKSYTNVMYAFNVHMTQIYEKFFTDDSDSKDAFVEWMVYNKYSLFAKDVDIEIRINQFRYAYVIPEYSDDYKPLNINDYAVKEFLHKRGLTLDDVKYLNVERIVAEFNESHYVTENGYLFKIL